MGRAVGPNTHLIWRIPISVQAFIEGALRPAAEAQAGRLLVDVQEGIPELSVARILEHIKDKQWGTLPAGIRPPKTLSAKMRMGVLVQKHGDGLCTGVKFLTVDTTMRMNTFLNYASGRAYVPATATEGPW